MPLDPNDQAVLERMWVSPIRRIHEDRLQKLCRGCNEWKNLEQLYKDRTKSGRTARCYPCEQVREGLRRERAEQQNAGPRVINSEQFRALTDNRP